MRKKRWDWRYAAPRVCVCKRRLAGVDVLKEREESLSTLGHPAQQHGPKGSCREDGANAPLTKLSRARRILPSRKSMNPGFGDRVRPRSQVPGPGFGTARECWEGDEQPRRGRPSVGSSVMSLPQAPRLSAEPSRGERNDRFAPPSCVRERILTCPKGFRTLADRFGAV
jgi:hypothetical protein